MVDMRRYLADGDEFTALTKLSSTVVTQLRREPEEAFPRTLGRVKAEMDKKKGGDIGLNAFVKLDLLYRLCGDRIANRKLRTGLKNPLICMTNIGVLNASRLSFGDLRPPRRSGAGRQFGGLTPVPGMGPLGAQAHRRAPAGPGARLLERRRVVQRLVGSRGRGGSGRRCRGRGDHRLVFRCELLAEPPRP